MNQTNKVVSNSLIYTVSGLLQKCFSLLLLPLYTAYLTTEDYGVTNIANTFILTMNFVVAFSLFSAVLRFYVDYKTDKEKLKRFYGSVILFVFISCTLYFLLLTIFRNLLSKTVFAGVNYFPLIFLCLISLFFTSQHDIYNSILKSQQKAVKCSILSISYFFLQLALNITFVVIFKWGATGVIAATLLAGAIYTLYFIMDMIIHKEIHFCLDFKLLKEALKYSIPIMPHNLSTRISMLVSSSLIGGTSSLSSLGIYSIAAQFGNMSDTILSYVNNAYAPWLFEQLHSNSGDTKKSVRKSINSICYIIGFFFLGIALFSQDYILLLLDKSYAKAWIFVPVLVSVFSIKIIYYFYVNILFYYKEAAKILFIATLSSSLTNVVLSAILIPLFGAYGSILSDGVATIICVTIVVSISKRFGDIGLRLFDFIKTIVVINGFIYVGLFLSFWKFNTLFSVVNLLYKCVIMIVYTIFVAVKSKSEIKSVVNAIKAKRRGKK